jgi:hypothetical protein
MGEIFRCEFCDQCQDNLAYMVIIAVLNEKTNECQYAHKRCFTRYKKEMLREFDRQFTCR